MYANTFFLTIGLNLTNDVLELDSHTDPVSFILTNKSQFKTNHTVIETSRAFCNDLLKGYYKTRL